MSRFITVLESDPNEKKGHSRTRARRQRIATLSSLFINKLFFFTNAVTSLPLNRCQLRQWFLFQPASEVVQVQLVRERTPVPVPGSGRGGAYALVADSNARLRVQLRQPGHRCVSDAKTRPYSQRHRLRLADVTGHVYGQHIITLCCIYFTL